MGRSKNQITLIEENAKLLHSIDSHKRDRTITVTEYNKMDKAKIENYIGEKIDSWDNFKKLFSAHQSEIGFNWDISQGYAGPIRLNSIDLQSKLGSELSAKCLKDGIDEGDFIHDVLKKYLPNLYKYLPKGQKLLEIKEAKEEFKVPDDKTGYGFKFLPNSYKYKKKLLEYKYHSEVKGKHEVELGNLILKSLQQELDLDFCYHTQEEREGQKYKNIDIEGVKIVRSISEDFYEVYAFELKASNTIHSISEAISQAINYKTCSNYAYIIIPNCDFETFYDEIRLREYIEMCRQNKLGVISVTMKGQQFKEFNIILEAPRTELLDHSRIISLSKKLEFRYEKCHLCGKIVDKEHRRNCGWAVSLENEEVSHCMKLTQQEHIESYLKLRSVNSTNDTTIIDS